jgi:hypothetical protein
MSATATRRPATFRRLGRSRMTRARFHCVRAATEQARTRNIHPGSGYGGVSMELTP